MAKAAGAIGKVAKAAGPVMQGVTDMVGSAKGGGGGGEKAEKAKGGGDKKKAEDPVQQLAKILAEALKQASGKGAKGAKAA